MGFYDVLEQCAAAAGVSSNDIGRRLGRAPSYVSAAAARGSVPSVDNAAAMLGVCDYVLAAVPRGSVPPGALVIDAPQVDVVERERVALGRKRERLRRELAETDALLG